MGFDTTKWFKNQYLTEVGEKLPSSVARAILKSIPENYSYKNLAEDIAYVLNDGFGSHNFGPFMDVLHAELGIKESLNEDKESLGKEFSDKFNVPASSDEDSITIRTKDIIEDPTAEKMIDWIESKGYIVDRKRSSFDYDYEPGERDFWPRIRFNKK